MERLNADSQFVAERAKRDEEHAARVEDLRRALEPLLEDLRAVGCEVRTGLDLSRSARPVRDNYLKAIPVLLRYLAQGELRWDVREIAAHALAIPQTREIAWGEIQRLYRDEKNESVKNAIAATIDFIADDKVLDEMMTLCREKTNGWSRVLLLGALERSKNPRAQEALAELNADPQLQTEIGLIYKRLEQKKRREARKNAKK